MTDYTQLLTVALRSERYKGCLIVREGASFVALKKTFADADAARKYIDQAFKEIKIA